MRISTNIIGLMALSNLRQVTSQMQLCLTRLSTGLRTDTGADDPAALIAAMHLDTDYASELANVNRLAVLGHVLVALTALAGAAPRQALVLLYG